MKYVPPSIEETAFNCPHCSVLAKQFWYTAYADPMRKDDSPQVWSDEEARNFDLSEEEDPDEREKTRSRLIRLAQGIPYVESRRASRESLVSNLWLSRCFNCEKVAIWVYDKLLYPNSGVVIAPNPDLPPDIRRDYDEAAAILDKSPRGAAALIRLAIQKLCVVLGQAGKNINDDIKALVASGLDPRVQKALDVVRVVGNNAVHPGQIDLRDDRATAETLFRLLNLVAEKMISEPKHVDEVYASLPQSQLDAIQRRDKK